MRWKRLGPGGGGAMYIPTVHAKDEKTMILACDMTGSYLTRDGGESFSQINFFGRAHSYAFDAHHADTLYVGASGLYVSHDVGMSFELIYPGPDQVIRETTLGDHASHAYVTRDGRPVGNVEAILPDPLVHGGIWLGLSGTRLQDYFEQGGLTLLYSGDAGRAWLHALPLKGARFVKICPVAGGGALVFTDEMIYTIAAGEQGLSILRTQAAEAAICDATYGLDPATGKWVYFITTKAAPQQGADFHSGAFRSMDGGMTWTEMNAGLAADFTEGQLRFFSRIAVCQNDARAVYLSLCEPWSPEERAPGAESFFGVFKSEDMGERYAWALRIGDQNPTNRTLGWVEKNYNTGWAGAPFALGVFPGNADVCYATDWGTAYKTRDGGKTWEQLYTHMNEDGGYTTRGLDVTLVYHVHFDPFDEQHMAIACTDIGLFDSYDAGESWHQRMQGVPRAWINSCYCMAFDPEVRGRAWAVWTSCHDLPRPKMFKNGGFAQRVGGVCKTEDGLRSFSVSSQGFPSHTAPTCIVLDPSSKRDSRTLYIAAMGNGVYRSTDDGASWQQKNEGIGPNLNAWKIYLLPNGRLYLLVARGLENGVETDGAIYCSDDGAETWRALPMPTRANAPNFLAWDHETPSRLYLACWPRMADGHEECGGLWRSDDAGETWRNIYDESSHVYGVAVDPRAPGHVCLTNFENKLMRSTDFGEHFTRVPGYNFKWAHQPVFDPYRKERLYVATFGSGLWMGTCESEDA